MGNLDGVGRLRVEERQAESRQLTRTVYVPSPHNAGTRNMVQQVVDTVDFLRTRKKINDQEHAAAQRYRSAWDSSVGGKMDFERARGRDPEAKIDYEPCPDGSHRGCMIGGYPTKLYP
jgi:hypothetical protein